MARVEEFYEQADLIHREGCAVCTPIEGYEIGGIVITGINGVSIIEVDATYNLPDDQPAPFSLLEPSLKDFGVRPVIQSSPFVPPIDYWRLQNPYGKVTIKRWWQFWKR